MSTILEIIESRLIPDEQAKKARGEVFTPLKLVRELLYGIRKSDFDDGYILPWGVNKDGDIAEDDANDRIGGIPLELWRDPDTKWLDPANGIGNFPFVAFHMLDYQLKHHGIRESKTWSDEKRRQHIVGSMLYMIEIDRGNVNTSVKIFRQLVPGLTANVYCGDTLKIDPKKVFGVEKFDVVMGNPPFQAPLVTRTGSAGHETLWDSFIDISLKTIKDSGYLAFITPPPWRKPENKLWTVMAKDNHITYLRILGEKEVAKEFKVASRVDLYIIKKTRTDELTTIIDELGKMHDIDMKKWEFLPNYAYDKIQKIITDKDSGIKIIFNSFYDSRKPYIRKTLGDDFVYPIVHGITSTGLSLLYTRDNTKGHFGVPKVLLNMNRNQYPVNDYKGEYGMSQYTFGIPITTKEEGDKIVEGINSDDFKEIIKATKWGAFQTEYKMFKYFRPDFYKEFLKKPEEGGTRHSTPRKKKSPRVTRRNS